MMSIGLPDSVPESVCSTLTQPRSLHLRCKDTFRTVRPVSKKEMDVIFQRYTANLHIQWDKMGYTGRVLQCVLHLSAAPPIYCFRVCLPADVSSPYRRNERTAGRVLEFLSAREHAAHSTLPITKQRNALRPFERSQIPRSQVHGQAARCMWPSRAVAHLHTCGRAGVGPISWYLHHLDFIRQAHNIIVIDSVLFSKELCARVLPLAV